MIQMSRATCVLLLIAASFAQNLCPRSKEVGNYINYIHLFKEEGDSLLSFYNAKTAVEVVYQSVVTTVVAPIITDHRIVFRVTDNNLPRRVWIMAVWVKLNSDRVIIDVVNYMKFLNRADPDTLAILRDVLQENVAALTPITTNCFTQVIKLEYDYFYYMFANYYKNGLGERAPKTTV